jgi:hypothetical protein
MAEGPPINEEQVNVLRAQAARSEDARRSATLPSHAKVPAPAPDASYYGNPVLKPPTWTWEVPLYLFLGGTAGAAAVVALVAHVFGAEALIRAALWIAFAGAALSPPLLISDLGRPARFLYMMRVFKLRSVMSVGVWTLISFSTSVTAALVCRELILAGYANNLIVIVEWVALIFAALFGMLLASYTSVLLSVTAIPVWSENRARLPVVFLAGALGSAGAALELVGFLIPATQLIGIVASSVETLMAFAVEFRHRAVDKPLREGASGGLLRAAALLAGPVSLLLRVVFVHTPGARYVAALCFLAGAVITRYGWIVAGRASSRDPHALFAIQRQNEKTAA